MSQSGFRQKNHSSAVEPPRAAPRGNFSPSRWKWLRITAWASFVANVGIIGTGGTVRLTGSGLGCPTWPLCTPESLVPTEALSWHSAIEFGNRTLTGVLGFLALAVLILVWKHRTERRDLFKLAAIVLGGVIAQAIVGGITVLTGLNSYVVGFHYLCSAALVAITAAFLVRYYEGDGPREVAVPRNFQIMAHITSFFIAVTLVIGVLTTGAGPHSGDANVRRDGVDASLLAHLHSWPGYISLALLIGLTIVAVSRALRPRKQLIAVVVAYVAQILIGVYQARNGLPAFSVGVHMVLASIIVALTTWALMRLKQPAPQSLNSN